MTTAATHVCVLCMRFCNGITAYILLHYLMKFHLEILKDKEMTSILYVLSDHPSYKCEGENENVFDCLSRMAIHSHIWLFLFVLLYVDFELFATSMCFLSIFTHGMKNGFSLSLQDVVYISEKILVDVHVLNFNNQTEMPVLAINTMRYDITSVTQISTKPNSIIRQRGRKYCSGPT